MKRSLKRLVAVFMLFLHIEGSNKRYLTIRNNKNVITGEEGRLLAESILSRTRYIIDIIIKVEIKMDNIRIREDKNRLIIKKGWIAKKFIILYFVIVASVLLLYVNSSLPSDEFKRKYPYVIFFIRFSAVSIYFLYLNRDIKANFILESIDIDFINRKISLQLHKRNKILDFKEVKKINIRDIKNIDAEKNPKEKYTLEFIINEDSSKYLWGFALSESKAQEIKEKLLKIFREEASYEVS